MRMNFDPQVKRIPVLGWLIKKVGFAIVMLLVVLVAVKFSTPIKQKFAAIKFGGIGKFFEDKE